MPQRDGDQQRAAAGSSRHRRTRRGGPTRVRSPRSSAAGGFRVRRPEADGPNAGRSAGRSPAEVSVSRHTAPRPAIPSSIADVHLIAGEQVVRERGRYPAEPLGPQTIPGRDVADHCRLPDLAGQRTEPERGAEQHRDLREEMRRRVGRDGLERGYHHGSVSSRVASASLGAARVVQPFPCRRCHVRPVGVAVQLAVARTQRGVGAPGTRARACTPARDPL